MKHHLQFVRTSSGMTLVELMVTVSILGAVLLILSGVLVSTGRFQSKTVERAEARTGSRQGLSLMTTELRQAGADPAYPPIGVVAIVNARADLIHIRADLDGDGVIQTAEPSEDVVYSYDASQQAILRDPGSGPALLIPNVTAMGLTYFDALNQPLGPLPLDAANAALVRAVGVTFTSVDRDTHAVTLSTRVMLRNT